MIKVEDGHGYTDANTYVDPAGDFATAYFAGHLYATAWTAATSDRKEAAVQMATRVIDASIDWYGRRSNIEQGLEYPRYGFEYNGVWISASLIPVELKRATLELALLLLQRNRTTDTGSAAPVSSISLGKGALNIGLQAASDPAGFQLAPLSDYVGQLLAKLGNRTDGSAGTVKIRRS